MKIGVAGWIGSGKTIVSKYLAKLLGFKYLDVDALGHALVNSQTISEQVKMEFGIEVMTRDLKIDRKKLGQKVFSDPQLLNKYNDIIHPKLIRELKSKLQASSDDLIVDAALLEKFQVYKYLDWVVLVEAQINDIFERKKREYTKEQILTIVNNQRLPSNPDFIIRNEGGFDDLRPKIEETAAKIRQIIDKERGNKR